MEHIFISYAREDRPAVDQLASLLGHAYDDVWYDRALAGGQDWWTEILKQIADCDHFVYLISIESLESEYCQKELEEAQRLNKHIVPVLSRGQTAPPDGLKNLQCINMAEGISTESQ